MSVYAADRIQGLFARLKAAGFQKVEVVFSLTYIEISGSRGSCRYGDRIDRTLCGEGVEAEW